MRKSKLSEKRAALESKLALIRESEQERVRRVKAEEAEKRKAVQREIDELEALVRREQRDATGKMAFALGDFLLRNGVSDPAVQKIVKSKEFDAFVRARRTREVFGLPPLPAAPKGEG